MDVDLLRDGEHFSTFDSVSYLDQYPNEMTTHLEDIQSFNPNEYEWGLESEREINGDIALIPVCDLNLTTFNDSPPNVDDFQKIMNDWQQFINVDHETDLAIDDSLIQQDPSISHPKIEPLDTNVENFDITTYLNDTETLPENFSSNISCKKIKVGVKKIDLEAQRYIIDEEDDVDVETISECETSPVLEAKDLNSLLEQFEATQIPELPTNFIEEKVVDEVKPEAILKNIKNEILDEPVQIKLETEEIDIVIHDLIDKREIINDHEYGIGKRKEYKDKKNRKIDKDVIIEDKNNLNIEDKTNLNIEDSNKIETPQINKKDNNSTTSNLKVSTIKDEHSNTSLSQNNLSKSSQQPVKTSNHPSSPIISLADSTTSLTPNKQILDSLPRELIARIKESGKRKPISVIPPIPAKKRGGPRMQEPTQASRNKIAKTVTMETVQLDHDYCSFGARVETYPKNPKKDSGFESAEEDDRTIIGKQPTVKNADGKLMVSLLKVNTIFTPNICQQKKKLNLEEYKKRREGFLTSQNNSQNSSPINSTCSSPLPEDENTKLLKHQEKLMRMAKEVLNTPPKGEKKPEPTLVITPPVQLQVPHDMEMKTLVSIGVNTDFKVRRKNLDTLAPVERLDEMKPLLQKVSAKINGNSLITSVIENIPKVIDSCDPKQSELTSNKDSNKNKIEHGEDKTIVYLPKNRAPVNTQTVECQTNISLIEQTKASRYRRRRQSSSSSCSSDSSRESRINTSRYNRDRNSNSSCSSRSSRSPNSTTSSSSYSSRSPSRSRSRSSSPRYSRKDKERLREVEERRVIYVGRVPPGTTRDDLKKRFIRFGPITNVSLHSRDHSYLDNYGFVTFANKLDAYEAIEHGNDDPWQPKYDLSFGGRRIFCQTGYSDLDNMRDESGYFASRNGADDSFDKLLKDMQEKLRKRKA